MEIEMNRMLKIVTSSASGTFEAEYNKHYNSACDKIAYVVLSLAEKPGRAIDLAIQAGGETAVQALFDALIDHGHRMVLVQLQYSPRLPHWVREKLEVFLYGGSKQIPVLFRAPTLLH